MLRRGPSGGGEEQRGGGAVSDAACPRKRAKPDLLRCRAPQDAGAARGFSGCWSSGTTAAKRTVGGRRAPERGRRARRGPAGVAARVGVRPAAPAGGVGGRGRGRGCALRRGRVLGHREGARRRRRRAGAAVARGRGCPARLGEACGRPRGGGAGSAQRLVGVWGETPSQGEEGGAQTASRARESRAPRRAAGSSRKSLRAALCAT